MLDLKQGGKGNVEFPHTPLPVSPHVTSLYNHSTLVKTKYRASLVAQWQRMHLEVQESRIWSLINPVLIRKIPHATE